MAAEAEGEAGAAWQDALLDVLLALLSRQGDALPSAALRDACEAVFRAVAPQLTPTGAPLKSSNFSQSLNQRQFWFFNGTK